MNCSYIDLGHQVLIMFDKETRVQRKIRLYNINVGIKFEYQKYVPTRARQGHTKQSACRKQSSYLLANGSLPIADRVLKLILRDQF